MFDTLLENEYALMTLALKKQRTNMGSIDTILKIFMNGSIMLEVWGLNKSLGEV